MSTDYEGSFYFYEDASVDDYMKLDMYDRLQFIRGMCKECVEKINFHRDFNWMMRYEYTIEILDVLEPFLTLFSKDINDNEKVDHIFKKIEVYISLLREGDDRCRPLFGLHCRLEDLMNETNARLPKNIELARLLDSLIKQREKISALCGVDEKKYFSIISEMKENSDSINDILESSSVEKSKKRKRQ